MIGKKTKGWLKLVVWSFGLWVLFAYVGPFFVNKSEIWQAYGKIYEETGIHSGALYYTDVPISAEAERATRAAVRRAAEQEQAKENALTGRP